MTMYDILENTKKELEPNTLRLSKIDEFIEKINQLIQKQGVNACCIKGGSLVKGTFIKEDFDVDLFIVFDYSYKDQDISAILGRILEPLAPTEVYGSRHYFQYIEEFTYELVPVLNVKNYKDAVNVTDMSPLHVEYILKHLKKRPELTGEIRLAKQFCKSIGVYGAESYISGFSGHSLDILIIHYGSFINLLNAASEQWRDKQVIDTELHLDDPEKELNISKIQSPLILVDPLQPDRNAAAALSKEKYDRFKLRAKEFLTKPSATYFKVKLLSPADLQKKKKEFPDSQLIVIDTIPLQQKLDIAGAKLLKAYGHIQTNIVKAGFHIYVHGWQFKQDNALVYFIIKDEKLSEHEEQQGPPVRSKKYYNSFITTHAKDRLFVRDKRVYALVKRKHRTINTLLKQLIADPYVKERVKKIQSISYK